MKKLLFIIAFVILSCKGTEKEKRCFENFTYFQSNLKHSYLLKINSSDTIYYLNNYSDEVDDLHYFLLEKSEKKKLNNLVCQLKFPQNDSILINNHMLDGTTINFSIDKKKLLLHGGRGPIGFWNFGNWIDNLVMSKKRIPLKRKKDTIKFDAILELPIKKVPPVIKESTTNSR